MIDNFMSLPFGLRVTFGIFAAWGLVLMLLFWRADTWKTKLPLSILFILLSIASIVTGLRWGDYIGRDMVAFNKGGHRTDIWDWPSILTKLWVGLAIAGIVLGILFAKGALNLRKHGSGH